MLATITHRGPAGREIIETGTATLGLVFAASETQVVEDLRRWNTARDGEGRSRLAEACIAGDRLTLTRDALGVAPLYYGRMADGTLCFASEVKVLLALTRDVRELPPGCFFDGLKVQEYFRLAQQPPLHASPSRMARKLRSRLAATVAPPHARPASAPQPTI